MQVNRPVVFSPPAATDGERAKPVAVAAPDDALVDLRAERRETRGGGQPGDSLSLQPDVIEVEHDRVALAAIAAADGAENLHE
jgi:hypothetical protein